ncbi:sensor histidine kinase [Dyadobacter sp. CY345]|uniref:tetratricopeptide repeat-containing sensor histidine kinase n=1 Tax=Dyadobacter sp. CY345 TaxID=2909335 RepID=UPI001F1AEC30|nr:sensor histidine kinase [Dyadobacter sp. CY345]MCF2446659.1 sensor histidine kinase [Dyadobacter sp. CY345]
MVKLYSLISVFLFLLLSNPTWSEPQLSGNKTDFLRLQLSLNYFTVVREGIVDQDSSLLLVSKTRNISRWPVVTEGFGSQYSDIDVTWFNKRDTRSAINRLQTLKGIDHTKLLVLLGAYYAFQPGSRKSDFDSASFFLSAARQESESQHNSFWLNQSLCLLGKSFFKNNEVEAGLATFQKIIQNSQKSGDKAMEAKAWNYQGSYCPPSAKTIVLKLTSIQKANELYKQINDKENQVNCLMNISYLSFLIKDMKGAETNSIAALRLEDSIKFPYKHYTYDLLALIYFTTNNLGVGFDYALKSVRSSETTKDDFVLGYFYCRVGNVSSGINQYEESLSWYKKALSHFAANKGVAMDIYKTVEFITLTLKSMDRTKEAIGYVNNYLKRYPPTTLGEKIQALIILGDNYASYGNYVKAEKEYKLADQAIKKYNIVTKSKYTNFINLKLGDLYYKWQKYDLSKMHHLLFVSDPERISSDLANTYSAYYQLFKIDSIAGNYFSALQYHVQYSDLKDLYETEKQHQIIETLRVQYRTEQNEKSMRELQREKILQLQRTDETKKIAYVGFAGALVIILLLLNRYYTNNKQKAEINNKNLLLQTLIKEKDSLIISKEWLLKEAHHRVKNNLHTIICLLESQAAYLRDDALKAMEISQHRIYAMSLIHQKLYQSKDLKSVDMAVFIPEFVKYLADSFQNISNIRFDLNSTRLELDVSQAVPLSLILNEAVTNAIMYAFPDDAKGTITVSLQTNEKQVTMRIADDGIGMDRDKMNQKPGSLGLKLMKGLSEDIEGDLTIKNHNGTEITIIFNSNFYAL